MAQLDRYLRLPYARSVSSHVLPIVRYGFATLVAFTGAWPESGNDVTSANRSCSRTLMATGEETGRIKLFRAPVNQRKVRLPGLPLLSTASLASTPASFCVVSRWYSSLRIMLCTGIRVL
jgi:hypothetical protein